MSGDERTTSAADAYSDLFHWEDVDLIREVQRLRAVAARHEETFRVRGESLKLARENEQRHRDRADAAAIRVSQLHHALCEYGHHRPRCAIDPRNHVPCDCGIIQALKATGPVLCRRSVVAEPVTCDGTCGDSNCTRADGSSSALSGVSEEGQG